MGHKRPFGVNIEPERTLLIKTIAKFAENNSKIVGEGTTESMYQYLRLKFTCPSCGKEEFFRAYKDFIDKEVIDGKITEQKYYWIGYYMITDHIKPQIRMNGCKKHMQGILNVFGKKKGLEILGMFAIKNLIVAKLICEFIKSKSLKPKQRRKK